jgi:predicted transposase/invertase (TIGR01784 family)
MNNYNKLKDFLKKHSSEVHNMLITAEYDPKEEMEALREEAWEYGHEEGMMTAARNALAKGIPVETVQEITGLDMETIKNIQTDTQR